jgi:release factor glutamine methyltransferase
MSVGTDANNILFQELTARLSAGLSLLPDKPEETPDSTLRALWHAAADAPVSVQKARTLPLPELDAIAVNRLQMLIEQRVGGIPLAHLTGRQRFMGLELLAGKEALIPRQETELLGLGALEVLRGLAAERAELMVVDVCTGSGNLALSLAFHIPKARIFAADLSSEAVALARRNAFHLGLHDKVEFREGDLLAPFDDAVFIGQVDLLVCNPPYISSKKVDTMPGEIVGYEPRLAFDGGPLGIRIVERLMREAPRFLRKGGFLAFEVGLGQGPALVKRLAGNKNYTDRRTLEDAHGEIRVIVAQT